MSQNVDYDYFLSKLPELLPEHKGQFVQIKDQKIHGFFSNIEEALKDAYQKFGNTDFLIQEITNEKRANYINFNFFEIIKVCQCFKPVDFSAKSALYIP